MNPAEHGEVFVTADGAETDLDLGHYERFMDVELSRSSSLMNGQVYAQIIADERAGKYLGKTVQIIPHVTGTIQDRIVAAGEGYDIHIVEIGGTVGDYESLAFLDAIRQFYRRVGAENMLCAHVVYLPYLEASKELKTKPAQNTVRDLRAAGVQPDVIFARAERPVSERILQKIGLFCDLDDGAIVPLPTAKSVYQVPLTLEESGIAEYVVKKLGLEAPHEPYLSRWTDLNTVIFAEEKPKVRVGVVAKYMDNEDTYMSVFEALKAAGWSHRHDVEIAWIDAEGIESDGAAAHLRGLDGIVVPGGFGSRGVEGKIMAANYARRHQIPYLGLCLGMQVAVIAVGRQVFKDNSANTVEVDPSTQHPVIALMDSQHQITNKGGTMRLGDYLCELDRGSKAYAAYGQRTIKERHRHRYEFNNAYRQPLAKGGLKIVGTSPDGKLVEIIELENHPFFVASQFHPEFTSRPGKPNPLFKAFIGAIVGLKPEEAVAEAREVTVDWQARAIKSL
jgi:CTP synthase